MRVLLVEDTAALRMLVAEHLRARGFVVQEAADGAAAWKAACAAGFDAFILDLGLPDIDGLALLGQVRAITGGEVPALILTARDSVAQRVDGLDAGADDYIVKPFEMTELEARLRAVLRRPGRRLAPVHVFADLRFDTAARTAWRDGQPIELTPREAGLFEELVRAGGGIVVRDLLVERLYRIDESVTVNALEAIVSRLRRKLAAAGSAVRIDTRRGIGYRLLAA